MKTTITLPLALSMAIFGGSAMAATDSGNKASEVQKQYSQYIEQGKSYKDAYQALQLEIAYETAAMQSATPCKKMVRGL